MSEEVKSSESQFPIPIPSILAIAALLASFLMKDHRLTTARPSSDSPKDATHYEEQTYNARLWEDPFSIWSQIGTPDTNSQVGLKSLTKAIVNRTQELDTGKILVLPVMLPGEFYAENVETRIRSRYAILSALAVSGYRPEDEAHISALQIDWPRGETIRKELTRGSEVSLLAAPEPGCRSAVTLCYEWFGRRVFAPTNAPARNGIEQVLVLWLDDGWFKDQALYRMAQIVRTFRDGLRDDSEAPFAFMGPRHSGTLRDMLPQEFRGSKRDPINHSDAALRCKLKGIFAHVAMYSATATAVDELLMHETSGDRSSAPREEISRYFESTFGLSFYNVIRTDGEVLAALLDELGARGVSPTNFYNHVALIAEWDTFWGRVLPLTFEAISCRSNKLREAIEAYRLGKRAWSTNIHVFTYQRGIDGRTAGKAGSSEEREKTEEKKSAAGEPSIKTQRDENEPHGRAQFDYINRLALQIEDLDRKLRVSENYTPFRREGVRAVGIVGSDPYDTLSILQALRARFPETVFFTTDLDARMFHPSQIKYSRNLIVASSFGLSLNPAIYGGLGVPMFRESHQTSQFLACLGALGMTHFRPECAPPRIFEIGRSGPIDLSINEVSELHPETYLQACIQRNYTRWGLLVGSLVMSSVLAIVLTPGLWKYTFGANTLRRKALLFRDYQVQADADLTYVKHWIDMLTGEAQSATPKVKQKPGGLHVPDPLQAFLQDRSQRRVLIGELNQVLLNAKLRKNANTGGGFSTQTERGYAKH